MGGKIWLSGISFRAPGLRSLYLLLGTRRKKINVLVVIKERQLGRSVLCHQQMWGGGVVQAGIRTWPEALLSRIVPQEHRELPDTEPNPQSLEVTLVCSEAF